MTNGTCKFPGCSNAGRSRSGLCKNCEQVREIRALAGTMSQDAIAARFGVRQTAVSRIIRRKTWADV